MHRNSKKISKLIRMRLISSRLRLESRILNLMKMRRAKRKSKLNLRSQMVSRKRMRISKVNPAQKTLTKVMKTMISIKDKQ